MVRIQLALGSQVSQGMGSSQFHFFVDLTGSYVQGATEEAREYGGVIDLVVHIASAGTIDVYALFLGFFFHNFRYRISHGKYDALVSHGLDGIIIEYAGSGAADKYICPFHCLSKSALFIFRIGLMNQFQLYPVPFAIVVENAFGIQDSHVFRFHSVFQKEAGNGGACCTGAVHNDFDFIDLLAGDFESSQKSSQGSNGGAMLVIMEYRDIHDFLQFVFNVIAFRRGNIFQIDAGKVLFQQFHGMDEFILVLCVENNGDGINVAESLVECGFAFHNRHGSSSTDVAQAQYAGTVGNNSYHIASPGHFQGQVFILLDFKAWCGNARGVYDSQVMAILHIRIQGGLNHLVLFFSKRNGFFLQFCCIHSFPPCNKKEYKSVFNGGHIPAIENFIHFLFQQAADSLHFFGRQILFRHIEKVIVQFEIMKKHFGMENIFLVYVHVNHVIGMTQIRRHVVLDGIDPMVNEDFLSLHVPGKAPDPIVRNDNVCFKGTEQEIQGFER